MFYNYESEDFIEQVEAKIKYGFITLNNNKQMTGIELITKEREEQITKHNYSVESDKNNNTEYQLVDAVNILIIPEENMEVFRANSSLYCPIGWSIEKWNNALAKPFKERLAIGGALLAAEIDRVS